MTNVIQELWPAITFEVNLETVGRQSNVLPSSTQLVGNETSTEADNMKNSRSTWLASLFPGVEMVAHKHGYQFTAYGKKAIYYRDTYVTGSADDVLKVVE